MSAAKLETYNPHWNKKHAALLQTRQWYNYEEREKSLEYFLSQFETTDDCLKYFREKLKKWIKSSLEEPYYKHYNELEDMVEDYLKLCPIQGKTARDIYESFANKKEELLNVAHEHVAHVDRVKGITLKAEQAAAEELNRKQQFGNLSGGSIQTLKVNQKRLLDFSGVLSRLFTERVFDGDKMQTVYEAIKETHNEAERLYNNVLRLAKTLPLDPDGVQSNLTEYQALADVFVEAVCQHADRYLDSPKSKDADYIYQDIFKDPK